MILRALPAFVFGFIATANALEVVIADRVIDEAVPPNPAPAPAEAAKTTLKADGVPKNKFTARDVEVRISDGLLIRGQLKNTDTIALKTDYGRLVYPIGDIVKINVGRRLSAEQTWEIDLAVTNLDSDDFDKRTAAQMTLESMGENAVLPLQAALKTAGTEAKSRIEKILRKTQSKASKA